MQAKVSQAWPWKMVRAFGGLEYVAYEWRRVPSEFGDEAGRLEADGLLILQHDLPEPELMPEPAPLDITDAAFALAVENHLNPRRIIGTGAGGRILVGDVRALLEEEE